MDSTNWEKVKDVFALALEQPRERREHFLRAACGEDAELRGEVESLLEAHDESRPMLERKDFGVASLFDATGAAYEGKEFGRYKVIRELGRGGMGAVFLAERADGEFQQQVALKIVGRTFADAELVRRFRRERQILASLSHPNIARLLDGGVSQDGEPYLVMEYVEGVRIDEYCEGRRLSTAARLRLFLAVCRGVAYAHQNLVVHRDIKPSNVLVTSDGTPKLLDFGIAKLLDAEHAHERTETNFRAFTPDYAAPEQVSGGQITTASDVYSLGVLLDDLLHGTRRSQGAQPDAGRWRSESSEQKTVATNLPTKQDGGGRKAEGQRSVGGELKNIVSMARREEPQRRYNSVAQLAEDVQRYLDGLPVRAQKDSFTYRAGKFVRRNKVSVGAAAVVLVSLVVGLALALWQANVARRERDRAERRFSDVRQLSNALLNDIAPKIERLEGSTAARQSLVAQSLKYLDSLAVESADDTTLRMELAAAYEKVGVLQGDSNKPSLSDFRGAIASLEKAQTIRRRLLTTNPGDAENRRLLADNLRLLGVRRMSQSDIEGGLRDGQEAAQIYENLVAEAPDSLALRLGYLETRVETAISYVNVNRFAEAIPLLERATSELETLRRGGADDVELQRILSKGLAYLGFSLSWESRQPEAEARMNEAVSLAESLAARYPHDANVKQDLWRTYQTAAVIHEEIDNARMFELSEKARRVAEETVAADRANAQARHNLARTYSRLSTALSLLKKPDEAISYVEKGAAIYLELMDKDPLNRGYDADAGALYAKIGNARWQQRDYTATFAAYQKAIALFEKRVEGDAADTQTLRNLATTCASVGQLHAELVKSTAGQTRQTHLAAAKENYRRALDLMLKTQEKKTLPEWDLRNIDEMRAALAELEKLR
ncbi:MAG TPA: serine/threonine-protein kinase [Pyrinomonadaceae bacterium]|nr:serine/threonine-protein kinase [Pyrinomonadaceae bacterium]